MEITRDKPHLIFILFVVGMLLDLLLIEHFEMGWQMLPVVFLVVTILLLIFKPKWQKEGIRIFNIWMYLGMIFALVGLFLHLKSNWEFATELYTDLNGLALVMEMITGAIPVLSPAFLIPIALFGLYLTKSSVPYNQ